MDERTAIKPGAQSATASASVNATNDGRSIASLMLILSAVFVSYFAIALNDPALPRPVHEALASVPLSTGAPGTLVCDARGALQ